MLSDSAQKRLMNGKATPDDLKALHELGWTLDQLSRRLKLARGTIKRAIRHAENGETRSFVLNVRPCLITGNEDKMRRNAVYYTPADVLHRIANNEPMGIEYYKVHEARALATRRAQRLASLKRAGVDGATIRIYLKYHGKSLV